MSNVPGVLTVVSLPRYAKAVNADMIIMMSSSIDKWNVVLGSYAQQMLNKSHLPLLAVKPMPRQLPSGFSAYGG